MYNVACHASRALHAYTAELRGYCVPRARLLESWDRAYVLRSKVFASLGNSAGIGRPAEVSSLNTQRGYLIPVA